MEKFTKFTKFILYIPLLPMAIAVLFAPLAPAHAQGPLPTPTPLPRTVATLTTAQQAQSAAQASLAEAARLRAQADEMERNGQAQYAQAQSDINASREAAAAQNGIATGEAIGRVESTLSQMRDTVAGQAGIIITLTNANEAQVKEIYDLKGEVQSLKIDKQTINSNYEAVIKRADEAQVQVKSAPVVTFVFIALFVCVCAVLIVVVLQRRGQTGATPDVIDTSYNVTGESEDGSQQ
jgi:hypothetical protein